jgi:hypothetical protein
VSVFAIVVGTLIIVAVPMWYVIVYKKRQPKNWYCKGVAPPFFWEAIAIMAKQIGLPQAGYIEWVIGPFMIGQTKAAGAMLGTQPIRIKVMYVDPIDQSALAHELVHAKNELDGIYDSCTSHTPEFYSRVMAANAAVREAMAARKT